LFKVVLVLAYLTSCFSLDLRSLCVVLVFFKNIDAISKVNKDCHKFQTRRHRRCSQANEKTSA